MNVVQPPIVRFFKKVEITGGCWLWEAALNNKGYASLGVGNEVMLAHRFSYTHFKGPIPEGMTVDHICNVRNCVNPLHLQILSFKENLLKGGSPSSIHARKTECPKGHPYDRITKEGSRLCSTCNREWQRNRRRIRIIEPKLKAVNE